MKKILLPVLFVFALTFPARATTRYVSQGGGTFNGGTACNGQTAVSVASFNASSPSPGDVVYLCGVINSTVFVGSSGTSGNVITIKFDTGAKISLPVCNGSYGTTCLNIQNYTLVDGGAACGPGTTCSSSDSGTGIIEATSNGSGLATSMCGSQGILAAGNNEIRNVIIRNIYQHTNFSDNACGGGDAAGFFSASSNNSMHDLTAHDVGTGMRGANCPQNNLSFYNNYVWNYNWGFQQGVGSPCVNSNISVHDNHFGSPANWDDASDSEHHNGIFLFDNSAFSGSFNGVYIYNNLFDGDPGCCSTSRIYFGGGQEQNVYVFNNVFNDGGQSRGVSNSPLELTGEATQSVWVYNNTIIGAGPTLDSDCVELQGTFVFVNNVVTGCNTLVLTQNGTYGGGPPTVSAIDYNTYGTAGSGSQWQAYNGNYYSSLAAWRSFTGGESHSTYTQSTVNLNGSGVPQTGSPAISAGTDLSSSCSGGTAALCSSTSDGSLSTPVARPTGSTAWDAGAYYSKAGASAAPPAPTGLAATVD